MLKLHSMRVKLLQRLFFTFLTLVSAKVGYSFDDSDFFGVKTVVIDAGHGGHDPGCHGAVANEKDVCLAISLKLGKYIEENFPDVKVIYTRKTDVFIPLYERAKIANKAKADLFICVHANANDNKAAYGSETYVLGLHKSEANLKVAQRENSSILLEDDYKTTYENFDPNSPESYITMTLMQSAYLEQSLLFASKVQTQFEERVGRKNRGVKQAGYLVLHQTSMPSVLIETGFLTNNAEEKFLNSDLGQDYLASAIYRAFKEYKFQLEEKLDQEVVENPVKEKDSVVNVVEEKEEQPKKPKKNKKEKDVIEEGVFFKVQIATSSTKLELKPENFNGLENVDMYEAGGLFRYTVGKEKNITQANGLQLQVKQKGYGDAFIVAFKDGKRIPISEAIKIQEH